jgi:hypothetical protein
MIYEFAIDPIAVNNWQRFRYIYDQCGVEYGRLISSFPHKWQKMVIEACISAGIEGIERTKIIERLRQIGSKMVSFQREYDPDSNWISNAEKQHYKKPFRAIISLENQSQNACVLNADYLDEADLWKIPRGDIIQRKAEEIAKCASLLLIISKEILIIEPHFEFSNKRFLRPFDCLTTFAFQDKTPRRLELHTKDKDNTLNKKEWHEEAQKNLSKIIPEGFTLKVLKWRTMEEIRAEGKEKIHPRYVLTELGGIKYDYGLDEDKQGSTTDVDLLSPVQYKKRWQNYQKETAAFELVDELSVEGKKRR